MAAANGCQVVQAYRGNRTTTRGWERSMCFDGMWPGMLQRHHQYHYHIACLHEVHQATVCHFSSSNPSRSQISHTSTRNLMSSRCTVDDPGPIDGLATAFSTKPQRSQTCIPDAAVFRSYQRSATRGGCQEKASLTAWLTKQVVRPIE